MIVSKLQTPTVGAFLLLNYISHASPKELTQVDSIITHPHIPSPHWHQRRKSHSDAAEITLKKLASFSSIRLRGVVMARNRKGHPYCDVTTIRQTRYFRSDNVRFQDGDAVDIGKLGRGRALSSDYSFFLSMSALAQVHVVITYTHKTTVLLWCSGLCDIRELFSVRCLSICVAYSIDYIQQC